MGADRHSGEGRRNSADYRTSELQGAVLHELGSDGGSNLYYHDPAVCAVPVYPEIFYSRSYCGRRKRVMSGSLGNYAR